MGRRMFKKNKKAIQISINFIVILVIALFVFGLSVYFLKSVFFTSKQTFEQTSEQLDKQMINLACGNRHVCLSATRFKIPRAKDDIFGVNVYNSNANKIIVRISVDADSSTVTSVSGGKKPSDHLNILFGKDVDNVGNKYWEFALDPEQRKSIGILIRTRKNADPGEYVLNVRTRYCVASAHTCSPISHNGFDLGQGRYSLYIVVP